MNKRVLQIEDSARVLVLEDDLNERVQWFRHKLPMATIVRKSKRSPIVPTDREVRYDVVESPTDFALQIRTTYYDVILADYALRSWTGLAAFNLMRKTGRDIPFILVTGALSDAKAMECKKIGITDYILKAVWSAWRF